jgi:hypothetical protein
MIKVMGATFPKGTERQQGGKKEVDAFSFLFNPESFTQVRACVFVGVWCVWGVFRACVFVGGLGCRRVHGFKKWNDRRKTTSQLHRARAFAQHTTTPHHHHPSRRWRTCSTSPSSARSARPHSHSTR